MATLNNHVRRRGSYAPLSAHYYLDDALAQAGEEAELLYVRALAFCAATLADGYVSDSQLARGPGVGMKNARKRAEKLVEVGAWVREADGWRIRSWLEWNKSREEILAAAEADRQRKTRGGRGGPPKPPTGTTPDTPKESNGIPNGIRPESERTPNGIRLASGSTRARLSNSTSTSTSNCTSSTGQSGGGSTDPNGRGTTPRPRCPQHAHLPADDPGPPCHACRDRRLAAEAATVDADAAERARRADRAAQRDACTACDTAGWLLGDDGTPVEPARKCDHRPLRSVS